jgi:hypothetical protein
MTKSIIVRSKYACGTIFSAQCEQGSWSTADFAKFGIVDLKQYFHRSFEYRRCNGAFASTGEEVDPLRVLVMTEADYLDAMRAIRSNTQGIGLVPVTLYKPYPVDER